LKKGTVSEARAAVKEKAIELGEFTRDALLTAMEAQMPRPYAAQAADSMFKRDPEVRMIRRDSKRLENGQRVWTRVYQYKSAQMREEWPKSLAEVGAARAIKMRSETAAMTPSGQPAGYYTAPFRAPSETLPYGFPPEFNWDGKRGYVPPSAIAQLQAALRRPMQRSKAVEA
jgi:hypothetical protein